MANNNVYNGEVIPKMSLAQFFIHRLENNQLNPENIALHFNDKMLSFDELNRKSNNLANVLNQEIQSLKNKNPDGDQVISVCMNPSIEMIVTLFAISKIGAAYNPIDVCFPDNRIFHITNDCCPFLLITEESFKERFDQLHLSCKVLTYNENYFSNEFNYEFPIAMAAQEVAIVMYTSGSSGVPKGVRVTNRGVLNRILWQWQTFPYSNVHDEICCMKTNFTFADSVAEIFGPLLAGVKLCIIPKSIILQTDLFIQTLEELAITRIVLVPTLMRNILGAIVLMKTTSTSNFLENIKLWICSGETLDVELLRRFFKLFPSKTRICNFYGSTEVTYDATYEIFETADDVEKKINAVENAPIGKPIWNTEIYLLDDELKILPESYTGNIFVGGISVANGYVGGNLADKFIMAKIGDKLTEELLFRTGDLGSYQISREGKMNLYFEGRNDSQVKVRGNRVDLKEIELTLSKMEVVQDYAVLCYKQGSQDQVIVAFVMTKKKSMEIKDLLKDELQSYQMPEVFIIEFKPLLVSGKADRQNLLRMYEESKCQNGKINWDIFEIPHEDKILVSTIVESISRALCTSESQVVTNLNESFYHIGGSSLNTIGTILELRENGVNIDIKDFVAAKSILEIVQFAKSNTTGIHQTLGDSSLQCLNTEYFYEPLTQDHRKEVIKMVSYADSHKADLCVLLKITVKEIGDWLETVYDSYVNGKLSFVVKRKSDCKIVGSAINKPYFDMVPLSSIFPASKNHSYYFEFNWFMDQNQREKVAKISKNVFRSGAVETCSTLSPGENVMLIQFIEEININLARESGFDCIISTNSNACTQQIVRDVLGYEVLLDFQMNQFVSSDGTMPLTHAKDTKRSVCCFKDLRKEAKCEDHKCVL